MNQAKTALLLLMLTSILIGIGLLLDAWTGAFVMLGLAAIFNGYAFWYSDAIALRIYDARPADTRAHARLICIVHALARQEVTGSCKRSPRASGKSRSASMYTSRSRAMATCSKHSQGKAGRASEG